MGEIAREEAAVAHVDDAHLAVRQSRELSEPRSHSRQQPRRCSPIDTEPPAERPIAATLEIAAERCRDSVGGEKGGNDEHDLAAAQSLGRRAA